MSLFAVVGLIAAVRRLNQLLGNAASQHVRPPVHPLTENVATGRGIVIVIDVPDGLAKPYLDHQGRIWVKQGSDKRHVTSREEMQRMFQRSGLVYADVVPVEGTSVEDLDEQAFSGFRDQGRGVPRALEVWSRIDLVDDPTGNQFSAVAWRPEAEWKPDWEGTPQVTGEVTPHNQLLIRLLARASALGQGQ